MRHYSFSAETVAAIRHERYHHPHPRVQRKMEDLWLKSQGLTHAEIAALADVSPRSVQRYLDEFLQGPRRARTGSSPQRGGERRCPGRVPTLARGLFPRQPAPKRPRSATGHRTTDRHPPRPVPGPRLLEKTVGLGWRKVGTVPAKGDHDEQVAFLDAQLQPRLAEAKKGKRTVLFVDAAPFVYGPFLGYLWCLMRLFVPGPSGRTRYNVLAALDAVTHEVIRVSNHASINAESVCALLRAVAATSRARSRWCWITSATRSAGWCKPWRSS